MPTPPRNLSSRALVRVLNDQVAQTRFSCCLPRRTQGTRRPIGPDEGCFEPASWYDQEQGVHSLAGAILLDDGPRRVLRGRARAKGEAKANETLRPLSLPRIKHRPDELFISS